MKLIRDLLVSLLITFFVYGLGAWIISLSMRKY
jgi:predicted DNA repair protein MutK